MKLEKLKAELALKASYLKMDVALTRLIEIKHVEKQALLEDNIRAMLRTVQTRERELNTWRRAHNYSEPIGPGDSGKYTARFSCRG
jgi:hypothetical protein